jgi:hypothetical protein
LGHGASNFSLAPVAEIQSPTSETKDPEPFRMTPEIRAFEYALGLYSVLIGLAIADVAASFHRLARSRAPVNWDPLALLAAFYALVMAIGMWFDIWTVRNVAQTRHFFFYLSMVGNLFVLFLIAATSLPDSPAEDGDLRVYYERNRRYFWLLIALFQAGYIGHGIYFVSGLISRLPVLFTVQFVTQWTLLLVIPLALASSRSRAVHYAGLVALLAVQAWHYAPYAIN